RLHAAIINEINLYLQPLLPVFNIPEFLLSEDTPNDLGDSNYLEYILERELSRQFVTSKQNLIRDLLNYIRCKGNSVETGNVEIYGTTSFNLVWEEICKKIYKNDLDTELSNLNLKLRGMFRDSNANKIEIDYRDRKLLKDVIDKPIWRKLNSVDSIRTSKSLELDVLHVNHDNLCFEIFDGKYYTISINDKNVSGQPGVGDIIKQYLYQLAFKNLAFINGYTFTNTFVVPQDELQSDKGSGVEIAVVELEI
ncbi:LlaJI family restriction endonuclease, partial [Listeria monocytogenes]|nr:LlaJI family restriction endonuclease [Listeria monocytogenes]